MDERRLSLAQHALLRMALAAMVLGAILLLAGNGSSGAEDTQPETITFSVECTKTGDGPGGLACALVVTGLPEPLKQRVAVPLVKIDGKGDLTTGSAPSDTVVADEAPAMNAGAPVLVSRHLPAAPPSPPPFSSLVPEPPPKAL